MIIISNPRWLKIMRDLWLYLPRTILVILAIAIGIFGISFVLDTYSILSREIDTNYKMVNFPSATLWMDKVDADAVKTARSFPGIAEAEAARGLLRSRVQVGINEWKILQLYVVDDFNDLRISKFFPEAGSFPPGDRQILIERASMPVIKATIGNTIQAKIQGGAEQTLLVAGTVFDPAQDPAWVNDIACGYITSNTLKQLGGPLPQQGLRIIVNVRNPDRSRVREIADRLSTVLEQKGYGVKRVEVPIRGKFVQTDRIKSFLFTLAAFGLLCLVLSGFMTATLVSALLAQQIRQIGIMKVLGAGVRQIMEIYLTTVLILSLIALVISIPLSVLAGRSFAISTLEMLNFNVIHDTIPHYIYIIEAALGILTPLFTAFFPIYRGSRITVYEAIRDYGVNVKNFGTNSFDKLLEQIRFLPRPLALSLRNAFRRKGRMVLTLLMLAVGGAAFIASLDSAVSWNQTINKFFANINYDIDIRFYKAYPIEAIESNIRSIPGVADVEAWGYSMSAAFPKYSDGTYGVPYAVFAPVKGSRLIKPPIIEGRWLKADDTNSVVLDTDFIDNAEKMGTPVRLGNKLTLSLNGNESAWQVVGIMDKIGFQSAAYVDYGSFAEITGQQGLAMCARVAVQGHNKKLQKSVSRALEQKLSEGGFSVFINQDISLTRQVMVNHVVLILILLMLMSILIAVVGALGLASTMGINVMERTREIGIMRSIGASTKMILSIVILEGIVIGILSWLLSVVISIPATHFIAGNTGQFIFPRVMDIVITSWAPFLWLGIVLIIAVAASFYPAWKATRLTVREVLAYE